MSAPPRGDAGVEVPSSCANLGPGFDTLAAAVDLRLTVWTAAPGGERVISQGEGAGEVPTDDTNLVWRAFVAYCERFGAEVPDVSIHARNDIPLERGLGSSAAAAAAGAALGRAVVGAGGSDEELVGLVGEVEGHIDNAAAAVLGGIVACVGGRPRRFDPAPTLRPVVCVPAGRQSTAEARGLLPREVSLGDAAASAGRAALVLAGLTGACAFDPADMVDVLHEPARFGAMPESGRLVGDLRAAGLGACLSGAGPTVLAIADAGGEGDVGRVREICGDEWTVRPLAWDLAGASLCAPLRSTA